MNTQVEIIRELERKVLHALGYYSNVHRGSGIKSQVSTVLYEKARDILLDHLGLDKSRYLLIFCSPRRAKKYTNDLHSSQFVALHSNSFGLQLGLVALAIKKNALKNLGNLESGGGTAKLFANDWVIETGAPAVYEAGTPPVMNAITFAIALQIMKKYDDDVFLKMKNDKTVEEILAEEKGIAGKELLDDLKKNIIGREVSVPVADGMQQFVNLDHGASTSAFQQSWDAFRNAWFDCDAGDMAKQVKSICADVLHAPLKEYDVLLTANTTEAINILADFMPGENELVLTSLMEHSSNDLPWRMGAGVVHLSADLKGSFNMEELENYLKEYNQEKLYGIQRIKLIALTGASNVVGFRNNLKKLAEIAHRYEAYLLVDAAQLVAHHSIDMKADGIDFLVFSGHKAYAPFGSGALIARKDIVHFPKEILDSCGVENVAGNAAMAKALILLKKVGIDLIQKEEGLLTKHLLAGLQQISKVNVYGINDPDSTDLENKLGVVPFEIKGEMPSKTGRNLSLFGGIGIRTGCFCAHITVKHILKVTPGVEVIQKALTRLIPGMKFLGVARVSIGIENSKEDIDRFLEVLKILAGKDKKLQTDKKHLKKLHNSFISMEASKVFFE